MVLLFACNGSMYRIADRQVDSESVCVEKKPLVSVIIVTWNGAALLQECLDSLAKTTFSPMEIIVVDNFSSDNSLALLKAYPTVRVITNSSNTGYAKGNNIGVASARGNYVVILNNDITVEPGWLTEPLQYLEADRTIGIVCCRQMSYYHKEILDGLFHRIEPDLGMHPVGQRQLLADDPRFTMTGLVISANGGSMIVRKELYEQLHGLDENFFAYYEEVDFCLRAFERNWKCLYVPSAVVYHKGSVSFQKTGPMTYFYRERNRISFLYKNFPLHLLVTRSFMILLMELRVIRVLCFKQWRPDLYFRARKEAFSLFMHYKSERKVNVALFRKKMKEFYQFEKLQILPYGGKE